MADYIIDPGGGGDFLTIAACDADAGVFDGDRAVFVAGAHSVGTGVSLTKALVLDLSAGATLAGTGTYLLRGPNGKTVRIVGGVVDATNAANARGLDVETGRTFDLDETEIAIHASSSASDRVGAYVAGTLTGTLKISGGYADTHHWGVYLTDAAVDLSSLSTAPSGFYGRPLRIDGGTTGIIWNADLQGYDAANVYGIYESPGSACDVIVANAKIKGWRIGVYKPSATYLDKVKYYFCNFDSNNYCTWVRYSSIFANCCFTNTTSYVFYSDAATSQTAPDHCLWDETGTLATNWTAPTNTVEEDPGFLDSDFHIDGTSPMAGAGVAVPGISVDYDGKTRGTPPSIGALEPDSWTLTYTAGTGGTISGDTPQTVLDGLDGSEVEAVPDEGYEFVEWDDGVTTAARTDLAVSADLDVEASFELIEVAVAASVSPVDGGLASGDGTYSYGDSVSLEASAADGFTFIGWYDGDAEVSTDATFEFTATTDLDLTALFLPTDEAEERPESDWLWYVLPEFLKGKAKADALVGTFCDIWGEALDDARALFRSGMDEFLVATATGDTLDRLARIRQTYRSDGESDDSLRLRTLSAYQTKRKAGTIQGMIDALATIGYTVEVTEPNKGTDHWARFLVTVTGWDGVVSDIAHFWVTVRALKPGHTRALVESALEPEVWDDWEEEDPPEALDTGWLDGWQPSA